MYYLPAQIRSDEILLLVDNTVFGSAKAGLCLTAQHLFIREDFDEMECYRLDKINQVDTVSGMMNTDLMINSHAVITLTQLDRKEIQMLAEMLWQFIQFQRQSSHTQHEQNPQHNIHVFEHALQFLIYLSSKFTGRCSSQSRAQLQHLLGQAQLEQHIQLRHLIDGAQPAFVTVVQQLQQGSAQLTALQKRLIVKSAMQLMWINQYGYADIQKQIEDVSYLLNIRLPDLEQAIEEAMQEQTQDYEQEEGLQDQELSEMLQQACQLLGITTQQLNLDNLQHAYRRKMAEFHPDQYQNLPQAVRQLIEQQAQQLNQARDLLRSYLHAQ
ncbi:J domain-containing protein [Acinetobacter sp. MB5]|uniref:J domain-containing protein n=1 Tax=Acinetobacter sp. MB5 TaxID=2069438 RepID=UPI0039B6EB47